MDLLLNYCEQTGPMTRVGILLPTEEAATAKAMEILGTSTYPSHLDPYDWGFEVVFETAYV